MTTDTRTKRTAAVLFAGVLASASLQAAPTLRAYTGGDSTLWSATGSWSSGLPDGDDPVSLRSDTTATGSLFDLADGFTITGLSAGSRTADSGDGSATHTINLNSRTLNVAGYLRIGESNSGNTTFTGNLTLGNGTLSLSVGNLDVGWKTGTGSGSGVGTVTAGDGLVFMSADLARLWVGVQNHQSGAGNGTINFNSVAAGTLSIAGGVDTIYIGGRTGGSTGNGPTGVVTLGANWISTTLGSVATRADLRIGYRAGNGPSIGTFTQSGGTFTAYLNNWELAYNPTGSDTPATTGNMNLTGAANVSIDANTLRIATRNVNASGTLTLPAGNVLLNTSATIGGGTKGSLALNGTSFSLASGATLTVASTGDLKASIGAAASGVTIKNSAAAALVLNSTTTTGDRGLQLTFTEAPVETTKGTASNHTSILYGLKWEGDNRTTELAAFKTANKLAWNDDALDAALGADAVSIFFDTSSNATYVGVYLKKPQGTVVLVR